MPTLRHMKRLIIPAAVVALAALALWWFSPTRMLKRRTAAFIDTANVPAGMSDIGRGARGRNLAEYLAGTIRVDPPRELEDEVDTEFSRDQASALYSMVASYCREISITRLSFTSVEIDGDSAVVTFSADAIVNLSNRRPVDGLIHVVSHWHKTDGDWLLEAFEWTEAPRP